MHMLSQNIAATFSPFEMFMSCPLKAMTETSTHAQNMHAGEAYHHSSAVIVLPPPPLAARTNIQSLNQNVYNQQIIYTAVQGAQLGRISNKQLGFNTPSCS
jgi:hypothetical protein